MLVCKFIVSLVKYISLDKRQLWTVIIYYYSMHLMFILVLLKAQRISNTWMFVAGVRHSLTASTKRKSLLIFLNYSH